MKYVLSTFILLTAVLAKAQNTEVFPSTLLFWSAQDWPCEFIDIEVFNIDSNLVGKAKLVEKFSENRNPDCSDTEVASITELLPGFYYFIAACNKYECYVCEGEGSYWKPIIQDKSMKTTGTKSKANIEGTYKTCHVCQGDGAASSTIWIDTLTLKSQQCRSILLK
jgi:DnaJ-class molecular chaperone